MADPDRRKRALEALALSRRHHLPLSSTADRVNLTPEDVLEYVAEGFEPVGDDWLALPRDRIQRELQVLTTEGPEWIVTHDSRLASRIGQQENAVRHYLDKGDPSRLRPLTVRIEGRTIHFASDPQTIDRLAAGGEIHLEVYRR